MENQKEWDYMEDLHIHGRVVLKCSFSRRILLHWISPRQITVAEQATSLKIFSLMWHIFPELPKYAWVTFLFVQKQLQYLPNIQMIHKSLCQTIGSSNCFLSLLFCKKKTTLSIQMVALCTVTSCSLSDVYKQCTLICYHQTSKWQGNQDCWPTELGGVRRKSLVQANQDKAVNMLKGKLLSPFMLLGAPQSLMLPWSRLLGQDWVGVPPCAWLPWQLNFIQYLLIFSE